jgi:hypothetical protein
MTAALELRLLGFSYHSPRIVNYYIAAMALILVVAMMGSHIDYSVQGCVFLPYLYTD